MKAATGELNLTVITIVAIAAVIAFFSAILWPKIQTSITSQWNKVSSNNVDNKGNIVQSQSEKSTSGE